MFFLFCPTHVCVKLSLLLFFLRIKQQESFADRFQSISVHTCPLISLFDCIVPNETTDISEVKAGYVFLLIHMSLCFVYKSLVRHKLEPYKGLN